MTDVARPTTTDGRVAAGALAAHVSHGPHGAVLEGHKQYATGSLYADQLAVFARDDRDGSGDSLLLVVPVDRDGVEVVDDWQGFGQRFTGTGTVRLTAVPVAESDVALRSDAGAIGVGYRSAFSQLFLTAVIAGITRAAVHDATRLVHERKQHLYFAPTPVRAEDPLLQTALGRLSSLAFAAEATVLHAAAELDRADGSTDDAVRHAASLAAAKAKVVVDDLGPAVSTALFDLGGASATHRGDQLDRHWRNARTLASHNPALYKARAIGAFLASGEPLPAQGFF